MNNFLNNLIDRHHDVGVSQETRAVVEPRRLSRYESEPEPGIELDSGMSSNLNDLHTDSEPLMKHKFGPASEHEITPIAPQRNQGGQTYSTKQFNQAGSLLEPDTSQVNANNAPIVINTEPLIDADYSRKKDNSTQLLSASPQLDNRAENLPQQKNILVPEAVNIELKSEKKLARNKNSRSLISKDVFNSSNNEEHVLADVQKMPNSNLVSDGDLNFRIQDILQDIRANQKNENFQQTNNMVLQDGSNLVENLDAADKPTSVLKPSLLNSESVDIISTTKRHNKLKVESQKKVQKTGLLQSPNWLNTLRTEFQQNLQNANSQNTNSQIPTPQKIVNVTIGRIEIRASKNDLQKKTQVKRKPSSVMNLDDYLKERA